jgi:hypothetical protein
MVVDVLVGPAVLLVLDVVVGANVDVDVDVVVVVDVDGSTVARTRTRLPAMAAHKAHVTAANSGKPKIKGVARQPPLACGVRWPA